MDMSKHPKLAKLEALIAEQDAEHAAKQAEHEARIAEITGDRSIAAYIEEMTTMNDETGLDDADGKRFELLDRIAERLPELSLDDYSIEWATLPDGGEALVIDGGGFDGGSGYFIANSPVGDDLHLVGPTTPLVPGKIAALAIHPDGTRELVKLIPDPLVEWRTDDGDDVIDGSA